MRLRWSLLWLAAVFCVGCLDGTDSLDWSTVEEGPSTVSNPGDELPGDPPVEPPVDKPDEPIVDDPTEEPTSDFQGHPGPKLPEPEEVRVEENGGVSVSLYPTEEAPVRMRRRMNIDQLDASMRRVSGDIGWVVSNSNRFETLSATLGKPDYQERTLEDLEPSAIFHKFLGDASRFVCAEWMETELEATEGERLFFVHVLPEDTLDNNPEGIRENLSHLLLRFHGKRLDVEAPVLNQWSWLFESAYHVSQDSVVAWNTVCIALFSHPDFYSY